MWVTDTRAACTVSQLRESSRDRGGTGSKFELEFGLECHGERVRYASARRGKGGWRNPLGRRQREYRIFDFSRFDRSSLSPSIDLRIIDGFLSQFLFGVGYFGLALVFRWRQGILGRMFWIRRWNWFARHASSLLCIHFYDCKKYPIKFVISFSF